MTTKLRSIFVAGALLSLAAWPLSQAAADAVQAHLSAEEEAAGDWIDHVGCTFFGETHDRLMESSAAGQAAKAERRSALTIEVVNQLGARPAPMRSRSRNRPISSGPIDGDSIDDFIFGALAQKGIPAAPPTSDAEFLRRATIDLAGRIPTLEETIQFLNDGSPDKRDALIARLLDDPRWATRWTMFFGDLFRNTQVTAQVNRYQGGRDALHLFLRDSMRANKPYDQMARELISGYGIADGVPWPDSFSRTSPFGTYDEYISFINNNPATASPASYIVGGRTGGGPIHDTYDTLATNVSRDFLGITHMDCILCHDGVGHLEGLNQWGVEAKRSDGWTMAAFFQQVWLRRPAYFAPPRQGQARGPRPPYWYVAQTRPGQVVRNNRGTLIAGAYTLDTTGGNRPSRTPADMGGLEAAPARYFRGGGEPNPGEPLQNALARLMTADRQFARAAVNRIWAEFFGRGIVDPVDQFDLARLDPSNPPPEPWAIQPSHPELLEWLADEFIDSGYDLKVLMRTIVASDAYQLSSHYDGAWNPLYDQYFARHQARRLSAEALFDAVMDAKGQTYPITVPFRTRRALGPLSYMMELPDVQGMPSGRGPGATAAQGFLDAMFRGDREESPRLSESSILQALQLMNSEVVTSRPFATGQMLEQVLQNDDPTLVGVLYARVLSRYATQEELAAGVQFLQSGDRAQRAQDLLWTLMNKVDFVFIY